MHVHRKFKEKTSLLKAGISKDERKALRAWFKQEVKALFRCTGLVMQARWAHTNADLQTGGHGAFAKWFEDTHMSCTWKNWGFRASGVPGVTTNGNPMESWHAAMKNCPEINTARVPEWTLHGETIPALMKWCSVNYIGVTLRPDRTSPIPAHSEGKY